MKSQEKDKNFLANCYYLFFLFFGVFLIFQPGNVDAEILFYGNYDTGNFRQWARTDGNGNYNGIPLYGRPVKMTSDTLPDSYYGDGSLATIVTDIPGLETTGVIAGEVRQASYAAKFTVKSLLGGGTEATITTPGSGYLIGDKIYPVRTSNNTTLTVARVDGSGGILGLTETTKGTGTNTTTDYNTTTDGAGTGAVVRVDGKDCDPSGGGTYICTRRRAEVGMMVNMPVLHSTALPYLSERWLSISYYVPSDWDDGGTDWGPLVFQIKAANAYSSPFFAIAIQHGQWAIRHSAYDKVGFPAPGDDSLPHWHHTAWYGMHDSGIILPSSHAAYINLIPDFPDETASQAALASLNKGGWTDWIIHIKFNADHEGDGFLKVWKREDAGSWVHVLDIQPKVVTRSGIDYNRGIGYHLAHCDGAGTGAGMYMAKTQAWGLAADRVLYHDNIKIGSEEATFEMMTPDGLIPKSQSQFIGPPNNLRIN